MRHITDSEGNHWEVEETRRQGTSARSQGDALPEGSTVTVLFTSDDGREVTRKTTVNAIDKMTEADLVRLLEDEEEDTDAADN